MKTILITGGAGFIGYHLAKKIRNDEYKIVLIDNLNDYYSPQLKEDRLKNLKLDDSLNSGNVVFHKIDIANNKEVKELFESYKFDVVINLAAQAGVRYAVQNPRSYINSNINGFFNIIEEANKQKVNLFLFASSSSVYGSNPNTPWKETEVCDRPLSLYAATKVSDELIAKTYSHNTGMRAIGMRFFNVYGSWGRPDMAYYKWTQAILDHDTVELRAQGEMLRDMTYIDDVTYAIHALIEKFYDTTNPIGDNVYPNYSVFNIGHSHPVRIKDVLEYIAESLNIQPIIEYTEKGQEEASATYADSSKLQETIEYVPQTSYTRGIDEFIKWFREYYRG